MFGVKVFGNWKGLVIEIIMIEYENGEVKKVKVKFCVYSLYLEVLLDYVGLLMCNLCYVVVMIVVSVE